MDGRGRRPISQGRRATGKLGGEPDETLRSQPKCYLLLNAFFAAIRRWTDNKLARHVPGCGWSPRICRCLTGPALKLPKNRCSPPIWATTLLFKAALSLERPSMQEQRKSAFAPMRPKIDTALADRLIAQAEARQAAQSAPVTPPIVKAAAATPMKKAAVPTRSPSRSRWRSRPSMTLRGSLRAGDTFAPLYWGSS